MQARECKRSDDQELKKDLVRSLRRLDCPKKGSEDP